MSEDELAHALRNIGPVCAGYLVRAGIDTPQKLKKLGTEEAFLKTLPTILSQGLVQCPFHSGYLYAIEGAITDTDWRAIPRERKDELKLFMKKLKTSF